MPANKISCHIRDSWKMADSGRLVAFKYATNIKRLAIATPDR